MKDEIVVLNKANESAELDTLSEESYKDSTLIMQLLRDNLVSSVGSPFTSHLLIPIRPSGHRPRPSPLVTPPPASPPPTRPRLRAARLPPTPRHKSEKPITDAKMAGVSGYWCILVNGQ